MPKKGRSIKKKSAAKLSEEPTVTADAGKSATQEDEEPTQLDEESQVIGRKSPPNKPQSSSESSDEEVQASPPLAEKKKKKKKQTQEEDSSEEESESSKGGPVKKSKKKTTQEDERRVTAEMEEDLSDWLREQPILYDKSHPDFMKQHKKERVWAEKAASMGLEPERLKTWYNSTRTALSRLRKRPSGSGAQAMTARQTFQLRTFDWLKKHMKEVGGRQGSTSLSRQLGKSSRRSGDSEEEEEDGEETGQEEEEEMASSLLESTPTTTRPASAQSGASTSFKATPGSSAAKRKKKGTTTSSMPSAASTSTNSQMLSRMMESIADFTDQVKAAHSYPVQLSDKAKMRKRFIEATTHDILECSDELWTQFKSDIFFATQHILTKQQQLDQQQQQPSQQFHSQQPSQQFHSQQPSQQFHSQQPSQQFHSQQPSQQFLSQQPSQQMPSQVFQPTMTSQLTPQVPSQHSSPIKMFGSSQFSQPGGPVMPSMSAPSPAGCEASSFPWTPSAFIQSPFNVPSPAPVTSSGHPPASTAVTTVSTSSSTMP